MEELSGKDGGSGSVLVKRVAGVVGMAGGAAAALTKQSAEKTVASLRSLDTLSKESGATVRAEIKADETVTAAHLANLGEAIKRSESTDERREYVEQSAKAAEAASERGVGRGNQWWGYARQVGGIALMLGGGLLLSRLKNR